MRDASTPTLLLEQFRFARSARENEGRVYLFTVEKDKKRERKRGGDHKTDRLTKITAIDRHGAIRIRLFGELLFLVPSFVSGTISFERRRLRG